MARVLGSITDLAEELGRLLAVQKLYSEIPLQEIGKELGMPIGTPVSQNILPYVQTMKERIEAQKKIIDNINP